MIETAIIMAAGKGTRMLPLTERVPKVLIEVNGKPFLWYLIEELKKAGYKRFGIIAGYKKEQIEAFILEYKINGQVIEQAEPLGTADAVSKAQSFVDGSNFVVLGGDNLWSAQDLASVGVDDEYNWVAGIEVEDPSRYGVFVTKDDFLVRINEKPKEYMGNIINTGLYKFTPEIFEKIKQIDLSTRGEYEIVDAITLLATEGKVKVKKIQEYWMDFGCLEDIPRVEEFLREKVAS